MARTHEGVKPRTQSSLKVKACSEWRARNEPPGNNIRRTDSRPVAEYISILIPSHNAPEQPLAVTRPAELR